MAKISKERKITYYIGMGLMVLGFILFISQFFKAGKLMGTPFMDGSFGNDPIIDTYTFRHQIPRNSGPSFATSVIGMILMITGGIVMGVGAKGAAGSGLMLDPEKAREDLKPFSEAKGGTINDVISNIDVVDRITKPDNGREVIKIRCRSCGSLNDEDAKYCKSCGKDI